MLSMAIKGFFLLFYLSFAVGAARAAELGACREDTDKFCGAIDSGTTPVGHCLQQHSVELSTGCLATLSASEPALVKPDWQVQLEKAQDSGAACQDDIDKFCEGVQVGEGRLEKCLKAHQSKLSKRCKAAQGFH
jgi:hypothetical protein